MFIILKYLITLVHSVGTGLGLLLRAAQRPARFAFFLRPMKALFYALLTIAGLLALTPGPGRAATRPALPDNPTEMRRQATARERVAMAKRAARLQRTSKHKSKKTAKKLRYALLVFLGMEESKAVISPEKRDHRLHLHQQMLKKRAKRESRLHRQRCERQFN